MEVKQNVELSKYSTMRIGGYAQNMYIPNNETELIELIEKLRNNNEKFYIISAGSNVLINDKKTFKNVICLKQFNNSIKDLGEGNFEIGASIRLQKLIKTINQKGFGGIEYLYSVPGTLGGAIFMNAGRGSKINKSISDHIVSVKAIKEGRIIELSKNDCEFHYRKSIFQSGEFIILSATFNFIPMEQSHSAALINERMNYANQYLDNSKGNLGSIFKKCNPLIMKIIKLMRYGNKHVYFSRKTANWIINEDSGTFKDVMKLIKFAEYLHRLTRKKIEREIIIWD